MVDQIRFRPLAEWGAPSFAFELAGARPSGQVPIRRC